MIIKLSHIQSIFQNISVMATTTIKEFTLYAKTQLLKLFVVLCTHNKIHIASFIKGNCG